MNKLIGYIGYLIFALGLLLFALSYFQSSALLLFVGVGVLLLGIFYTVVYQTFILFKKDKTLDLIKLQELGLTIVKCTNCLKENVLEDQYCIYCNEKLESEADEI